MEPQEHTQFLRQRFVIGASDCLAGLHGSKENDKQKLGYTNEEWRLVWLEMLEDGAWALPALKDENGKYKKENLAPEMLIKFVAHDLKTHIIVFDLLLNSIQFCSGNHLRSNNVIFDSPLILYATGGHFQAIFQKDHSFFINLSIKLDSEQNPNPGSNFELPSSSNAAGEGKRFPSMTRSNPKKKKSDGVNTEIEETYPFFEQENHQNYHESRLEEIKKVKRKDRSKELQREYERLMKESKRMKGPEK